MKRSLGKTIFISEKGLNTSIGRLVITIIAITDTGRVSSGSQATALTIVVVGVASSARGEDDVPRLFRNSV